MSSPARVHGIRIRRLRLHAEDRAYDVDFRGRSDAPRPLSIIAGAFGTGKTTILEFLDYCLGASDHPRHPAITPKVRAATLEVELSGTPYLIERAVGEPSTFAYVCPGRLDESATATPERRPLRPAGAANSLSSLLLSHCKLEGVRLRDGRTETGAVTDPLSFRDLMWLCFLPSDRLDDRNLLFENAPMKHLKLRQVVDVVFDVHNDRAIELGRRIGAVEQGLGEARRAYRAAGELVAEVEPAGRDELAELERAAKAELAACAQGTAGLDERARSDTRFAEDLRERHREAADAARVAAALLRDRETQAQRMTSLRATYADDVSKLIMLAEAGRLFPPMRLDFCPSCLTPIPAGVAACDNCGEAPSGPPDVGAELRSARARLAELTEYLDDLDQEIPALRVAAERAQEVESRAAAEVDAATAHAVTPYLAQRDALARRREEAAGTLQRAVDGLRLAGVVHQRQATVDHLESQLATLRDELFAAMTPAAERTAVVERVSGRYRDILREWRFPQAADARLTEDLTPYTRDEPYTAASSGGRTLIALAWQLALFEIAWEARSSHPGFLLLDSPQKNLGAEEDAFIDRIYQHIERWLARAGAGAQIVVADNAPPATANADVVVRFSRRSDRPPYALIDDFVQF